MLSPVKIWRRQKEIRVLLGKRGKILTWTDIHIAGADFKKFAPYAVALVEFTSGQKAYGQLVDYEKKELKKDQSVIAVLRKVRQGTDEGIIAYGIKFKPI